MGNNYTSLSSEAWQLESMLAEIPEENVIERMSLEARLESVKSALERTPKPSMEKKAKLTFRGKPVLGSYGIAADFGAKAAGAFSDAFVAVAAGLAENLKHIGPLPNKDKHQLLITGTAIGSFGFEFELPSQESSLFPELAQSADAMEKIESLFRLAAIGSDDDVAELIDEIHPRSVKKVHDFLDLLVQQQAWCALEFGEHAFSYQNFDQLKSSSLRLKEDNIRESTETFEGEFQGVLPAGRTFEFSCAKDGTLVRGKVDQTVDDADVLNREWLHKPVKVTLKIMQVGRGQPRYTLSALADISPLMP
ncbi:hypothetical protein [Marinobacter zhejiangensis]|uniref:Uncharacterized protein n=1 Tax=Marinobacter zhejiangensis TaxID=488535 RepID=A0A1I4T113_9GAMM|nr:hypothetical protein [Marinobacter zhejiangensis]SFM70273.1 hypothetical protein SAMN04487963_3425 [Marinobacter zhejiangensis]